MKIVIEDLVVQFPYTLVFNEQIEYMTYLKRALDGQGHGLLEMPTGTGKTICLLALLTSYLASRSRYKKLVYCTRTVGELQKTLKEIDNLLKRRYSENNNSKKFLVVGLTSKKNLCVHRDVDIWRSHDKVDSECHKKTASWVRNKYKGIELESEMLCPFYQNYANSTTKLSQEDKYTVYGLNQLKAYASENVKCPYFTARDSVKDADIVVFNYLYLLQPRFASSFIKDLAKDTIVVFDEAHNIDDVCIQAYTIKLTKDVLDGADRNIQTLQDKMKEITQMAENKFAQQYQKLLATLVGNKGSDTQKDGKNSKTIDKKKIVPTSIVNTSEYLHKLKQINKILKGKLQYNYVLYEDVKKLTDDLSIHTQVDENFYKLASRKLSSIFDSFQILQVESFANLQKFVFSIQMLQHNKGFKIVFEPHPFDSGLADPKLTFACLDASIAMKSVFQSFPAVVLTSGTISPLDLYPKLLGFKPLVSRSINIELARNPINPMIVTSTASRVPLTSQYTSRQDKNVSQSYAQLLSKLSDVVPDGILAFFPSYQYMQFIVKDWDELKMIDTLMSKRYIFMEKKDPVESLDQLNKYRKACDIGRGAIFLAIARGKIAEGIDFEQHYGRCVVMMGFPVQNSNQPILKQRIKYMVQSGQLKDKNTFFEFDTMRQCAQCLGRVMRRKNDYGLMIMADDRFKQQGKYMKLPVWIRNCLDTHNVDITTQAAIAEASSFFRLMGIQHQMSERLYKREAYFKNQLQLLAGYQQ